MLSVGWLIAAVVVAILLTTWVTFTLTRLDRLHARVDAAQAALDAQLVRRSAALLSALEGVGDQLPRDTATRYALVATAALHSGGEGREAAENAVGRVVAQLADVAPALGPVDAGELQESCVRVVIARRFYNDAVRDTRVLRSRRMPRILHLAGHRELPQFFDIDDSVTFTQAAAEPDGVPDT